MDDFIRQAEVELEWSEREVRDVRAILADAAARLLGEVSQGQALTALQFQDISDQLLASALRRIAAVRAAMRASRVGGCPSPALPGAASPVQRADLQPGPAELF